MDLSHAQWRKSSRSTWDGSCVEISSAPDCIFIRDSKNSTGPTLTYNQIEWTAFLDTVKNGNFDLH